MSSEQPLAAEVAIETVATWRADPDAALACPRCGSEDFAVHDRSARPITEWYQLVRQACGLDQTVAIPLAPPSY